MLTWPHPSASAIVRPRPASTSRSSVPWITTPGHAIRPACAVASARSITLSFQPRKLSSMVSASVSSDQSTASSICFVECGSLKHSPKKNSVYPRQSRSQ